MSNQKQVLAGFGAHDRNSKYELGMAFDLSSFLDTSATNSPLPSLPPLSTRQEGFLRNLALGASIKKAAELSGLSERTARRYVASPSFQQHLRQLQVAASSDIIRRLIMVGNVALNYLFAILSDVNVSPRDRLKAIELTITLPARLALTTTLEARLAELENLVNSN